MSYLTRLSARAVGSHSSISSIVPKAATNRQAPVVARMEADGEDEEAIAPIRAMRSVRRQETPEEPESTVAAARQQSEEAEELAPLRRQEQEQEEESAQPLRRQKDDEELAPMRAIARQEEIPLEESARPAPPPGQAELEPGAGAADQNLAGEEEPSDLQALHRDMSPAASVSETGPTSQVPANTPVAVPATALQNPAADVRADQAGSEMVPSSTTPTSQVPANTPVAVPATALQNPAADFRAGLAGSEMNPSAMSMDDRRPTVVIDQLDVLIHEPATPPERSAPRRNRDRAMRARYLHRL